MGQSGLKKSWVGVTLFILLITCPAWLPHNLYLVYIVMESVGNGFCLNCLRDRHHHHAGEYRSPSSDLKTLTSAEADFRANDRDGNGRNDFWRDDVAGLYFLCPPGAGPLELIERSTALADDRARHLFPAGLRCAPRNGYWFRAIRHADEGENSLDSDRRIAFCCFPAEYPKSGRWTFIIDENNTTYRADLGRGRGIEVYPTDEELELQWTRID